MSNQVNRRDFLASSALAIVAASTTTAAISASRRDPEPLGPVVGRTGPDGLAGGTSGRPSRGTVTLLDGRTLLVTQTTRRPIGPDKSVLIAPEPAGGWSVLYAEC